MAGRLGKRVCKELLNHLTGKTPDTTPAGVVYFSLHTGDPGADGQTANEATGTSYARVGPFAATDWVAATNASPSVATTATAVTFPTAGGDWSAGVNMTYVGVWDHLTLATEAHYLGACLLTEGKPVLNGDTFSVAIGALTVTLT